MEIHFFDNFEKDATSYSLLVVEDEFFLDKYGGKYLTVLFVGTRGCAYFLNNGFKHPSYLAEKYSNLTYRDAENFSEYLIEKKIFALK